MLSEVKPLTLPEVLMTLDGGGTVEEIQEHIRKVSDAVRYNGGAGTVTIKLNFKRNGKEGSRQLAIKDTVSSTLPKIDKGDTLFFVTDEGDLTRNNPDQLSLRMGDRA